MLSLDQVARVSLRRWLPERVDGKAFQAWANKCKGSKAGETARSSLCLEKRERG